MVTTLSASLDLQYLVEVFPRDSAGVAQPQYLGTHDVVLAADDPTAPNREYDGRVLVALSIKREMFADGRIGGPSLPAYGVVEVVADTAWIAGGTLALWKSLGWDGARVRVLQGPRGSTSYAAHTVLLDGQCAGGNEYGLTIKIPVSDLQAQLDKDIQSVTYDGSGGFNGGTDLKGKPRPDVFGTVLRAPAAPVDPANLWYDLAYSGLHSVTAVYDGGVPLSSSASNPPPAGSYYADLGNGRVRLGSVPAQQITVDCRGAFGTNANTAATIASALLTGRLGFTGAQVDATAFAALDALNGATVGLFVSDRASGQDALDQLLGSVGAFYSGSRGLVTVGRLEAPTATDADAPALALYLDDADLERGSLQARPEGVPPYRILLRYAKCWAGALRESDLAGAATAAQRAFFTEEFRSVQVDTAAVQTLHTLSKPLELDSLLVNASDAGTEAARLAGLYSTRREILTAKIQTQPFAVELGDQVWLSSDTYGIDHAYRVIGVDESSRDAGRVTLTLWG